MALAREQFRKVAERYARSRVHADKRFLQSIVSLSQIRPGSRVLDLATGTGFVAVEFARNGSEVVGTDLTREMLQGAKRLSRGEGVEARFVLAEASKQPFPDGSFDVVTSRLAFHHMKDPASVLEEMVRVCRPHGRVVVADLFAPEDEEVGEFQDQFERLRDPSHVRDLRLSELRRIFDKVGLRVEGRRVLQVVQPLDEWAERAGCDRGQIERLRRMLEGASPRIRRGLGFRRIDGRIWFRFRRVILVGSL